MNQSSNLASALLKYLSVREPERFSHGEYLHVTDLYNSCFRQIYYSRSSGIPVERYIPATLRMLFEMGKIVEERVRSWLMEMGIIYRDPQLLKNEDLKISGAPDIRLLNNTIVDIKGMDPAVFRFTAKRPLPRHEFQIQSYLWLDNSQFGKLFSATWGSKEKIPFRDHDINYNLKTGEIIKRYVSQLRNAEAGGKLPGRVCKSEKDPKAIICPFRQRCFEEEGEVVRTIAEVLG